MIVGNFRRAAAVAAVLLVLALSVNTLLLERAQKIQARTLNLMEHQQLLMQQMLLEVAGLSAQANRLLPDKLATYDLFDDSLHTLVNGGEITQAGGQSVRLAPVRNPAMTAQLRRVQASWNILRPDVRWALEADPDGLEFARAVGVLGVGASGLLALLDETIVLYQAEARREIQWLNGSLWIVRALLMALALLVMRRFQRRLVAPLARLREATQLISQGDFSQPITISGAHELEHMAHSLETMRVRLDRSVNEQARLLRLSQTLLAAKDEQSAADQAVAAAAELLQTEFSVLVLREGRQQLKVHAVRGWPVEFANQTDLSMSGNSQTVQTILRGVPVLVDDYDLETSFSAPSAVHGHGLKAGLSVPLEHAGRVVGALLVHSREPGRFGPSDARLLSLIANQTAVALANVQLLAAAQRRADEFEALQATAADTLRVSEFELAHLLQLALERAVHLLNASGGELAILNEAGTVLNIVCRQHLTVSDSVTQIKMNEGVMGRVAATRESLIVDDYSTWEGRLAPYEAGGWHASMAVPLLAGGRLAGVIGIVDNDPERQFDAPQLRLLMLLGQQASLAIEQARLFAAERQRVKEAETLREAGAIVAASLEQHKAIELILEQLAHVLPYDTASVQLLCEDYLEVVGGRGWPDSAQVVGVRFPIPGDNPNTAVIQQRKTHIVDEPAATYPVFREGAQKHIRSWLGVPLVVHDNLIGMLSVDSSELAHFTAEHARVAAAFADQVAIAINNTRLYEAAVRAAQTQTILYNVGREVSASLEPEQVYAAIHNATAKLMPTETFVISLLTESRQEIEGVYLVDRGTRVFPQRQKAGEGLSGHVLATGKPVHVNDPGQLAGIPLSHTGHGARAQSILAVPLRLGETVLGMLSAQSYQPHAYTTEQLNLLELLAVNAAIALGNARLFEQVQRLAITDPLTGLYNRRHLFMLGEREFDRARRYHRPLAVIILDIDHFKRVNDRWGHAVGDEVLRSLAQRCQAALRSVDILGRYGGEELLALLPENDWEGTRIAAERLRKCMAEKPVDTACGPIHVTLSLGFALDSPGCADLNALINQADMEMYVAKTEGRNRVCPGGGV